VATQGVYRIAALVGLVLAGTDAAAQFPRLAPPPPCRVPARTPNISLPINGAFESRTRGISIAVLPFDRVVDDAEREHVPWALQDGVTAALARNPRLHVSTPGSVARAAVAGGRSRDSLSMRLGVSFLVQGQFAYADGRQAATVAVYRTGQTAPVWRQTFATPLTLQRMVISIVGGVERAVVGDVERSRPVARIANDLAYDELAAGDFALLSEWFNVDSARVHYERALTLDPRSGVAAARVARVYALILEREGRIPRYSGDAALNRIFALTGQALARDSVSAGAEAWTARAMLARLRDPVRFTGALAAHQHALTIAPNDPDAVHELAVTLLRLGDDRNAESYLRRALQLEPNRPSSLAVLGEVAVRAERWGEACALTNVSIDSWPYNALPYAMRARARLHLAQTRDAYADAETAAKLMPGIWSRALRLIVDAAAGNEELTRRQSHALATQWLAPGRSLAVRDASYAAMAFLAVGDRRRAVEAIRRAKPLGTDLVSALNDRRLSPIRSDTAVVRILRQSTARAAGL
jgi:TolB-like protein